MWTLIIILSGTFGATSMAVDHVDGFTTPKSCNDAGKLVSAIPPAGAVNVKTTCVYKPVAATRSSNDLGPAAKELLMESEYRALSKGPREPN